MDRSKFQATLKATEAHGFQANESHFAGGAFGSWHVIIATSPCLRILWDGKDRWLHIQQETTRTFAGTVIWEDLAIAREAFEQTPEWAVAKLGEIEPPAN